MEQTVKTKTKAKSKKAAVAPQSTKLSSELVLLRHRYVQVPSGKSLRTTKEYFATVISNMSYFGFAPSKDVCQRLMKLGNKALGEWWTNVRPAFEEFTGDNKKMDRFVVYKNFPQEVLDMSEGEYWIKQILMYVGFPAPWFAQKELEREKMKESIDLKVVHLADEATMSSIFRSLLGLPSKWVADQLDEVTFMLDSNEQFDLTSIPFKENMVAVAALLIERGVTPTLRSASDVMRLAAGLSDGDISLRTNTKFKSFSRKERKFLLGMLNEIPVQNVENDIAMRKEQWKRLLSYLHPNDFGNKFKSVAKLYNDLYNNELASFHAQLNASFQYSYAEGLDLLATRPGEYMRSLRYVVTMIGQKAIKKFAEVAPRLTVSQLVKLRSYLLTCNKRAFRTIAPKGNWTKLKVMDNVTTLKETQRKSLLVIVDTQLAKKLAERANGLKFNVAPETSRIKLQTSDSELLPYGRGTSFPIPEGVNFIRSASYWKVGHASTLWFDNGWNFFGENWQSLGACCWSINSFGNKAAIFSGDPVSGGEMKGRAAQMIDIYLDKLEQAGVRYAVWNILCYSRISFNKVEEVFGALQWGADPQKGKLFEPSRCQLAFPLKGESMTKYVAYIDVKKRELVYIDANLKGEVSGAGANNAKLSETMPAFVEYLDSLPSVHDLMHFAPSGKRGAVNVLYSDKDTSIKDDALAYVFRPENKENSFEQMDLVSLLR